jgi:hypothetical protein
MNMERERVPILREKKKFLISTSFAENGKPRILTNKRAGFDDSDDGIDDTDDPPDDEVPLVIFDDCFDCLVDGSGGVIDVTVTVLLFDDDEVFSCLLTLNFFSPLPLLLLLLLLLLPPPPVLLLLVLLLLVFSTSADD